MVTVLAEEGFVSVPTWVVDIDSFRRWSEQADFPEAVRLWWLRGEVWIDMTKEQIFTHLAVKAEYYHGIMTVVKAGELGLFLPEGLLLSNFEADICGNPDGTFILKRTLDSDLIRLIEGREGGYVEIQGSPDMVLEIVSRSSVHKDYDLLRKGYWEAGIREYWLVDARKAPAKFEILRHTPRGYVATRKQDGWVKSSVFGRSFRLTQTTNTLGHPEFKLEVR